MRKLLLCSVAIFTLGFAGSAIAQDAGLSASRKANVTFGGGGAKTIEEQVEQDVAAGLYTQEQGQQLIEQADKARENIQHSGDVAFKGIVKSGHGIVNGMDEAGGLGDTVQNTDFGKIGKTKEERRAQAEVLADVQAKNAEMVNRGIVGNIKPGINQYAKEIDGITQKRAELIKDNPNLTREQKFQLEKQASQVHRATQRLESDMDKAEVKIDENIAQYKENREKYVKQVEKHIEKMQQQYGDDPTKWPKAPEPTAPKPPQQQPQQPQQPTAPRIEAQQQPPESPIAPVTAKPRVPAQRGTVPSDAPDDAFSVNRNGPVEQTQGGTIDMGQNTQSKNNNSNSKSNSNSQSNNRANTASNNSDKPKPPPPPSYNPFDNLKKPKPPGNMTEQVNDPKTKITVDNMHPLPGKNAKRKDSNSGGGVGEGVGAVDAAMSAVREIEKPLKTHTVDEYIFNAMKPKNAGRGDGNSAGDSGGNYGFIGAAQLFQYTSEAFNQAKERAANSYGAFEYGGPVTLAKVKAIYAGYNIDFDPVAKSLSAAGNSIALNWQLPAYNGARLDNSASEQIWAQLTRMRDPIQIEGTINTGRVGTEVQGYGRALFDYHDWNNPWNQTPIYGDSKTLMAALYRNTSGHEIQRDPYGKLRNISDSARFVGSLYDDDPRYFAALANNDIDGFERLLAQPFNVVLTWGADSYDIDLHMTGPTGEGQSDRFHIYYAARGSLTGFPYAELIKDCICSNGSEVILTSQLIRGGVYRISAFNFGDQAATSGNLSDMSNAQIYIVRGGVATAQGNGTTIVGGRVIYRGRVPTGKKGNTWNAVEINAKTGRIFAPNIVGNSGGSTGVQ